MLRTQDGREGLKVACSKSHNRIERPISTPKNNMHEPKKGPVQRDGRERTTESGRRVVVGRFRSSERTYELRSGGVVGFVEEPVEGSVGQLSCSELEPVQRSVPVVLTGSPGTDVDEHACWLVGHEFGRGDVI